MSSITRASFLLLGDASFLLNPPACVPEEHRDDYQYGERELKAAVEGTWRITLRPASGSPMTAGVRLARASGSASAARRSLVAPAMAWGTGRWSRPRRRASL